MSLSFTSSCEDFGVEDMFFSRTDKRGVIMNGNSVFQRVSGYAWDELIGAPHKLIRHPDMPKAVFHLLWQKIQSNNVIGAYVCNLTKSGETYWVFATVFPLDDGYLSVRVKPTAGLLNKIVPIYNLVTEKERAEALTPEQSAGLLLNEVRALGFVSYEEFMTVALTEELQSRRQRLGKQADQSLMALKKILESTADLKACAQSVQVSFRDTHQIPYNMRLQAGRIEGSDGPISVISSNHRQMSQGLEQIVGAFSKSSQLSAEAVCISSLEVAMAKVLSDMGEVFATEPDNGMPKKQETLQLLDAFSARYSVQSSETLQETAQGMRQFRKQCRKMRRALSGLELTRIMCKIERFKIGGEHSGLDEIVNRLASAQKSLEHSCDEIERLATLILGLSENLTRDFTKKVA